MSTPWLDDGDVRLYHGDALEQLALMPSESVHCIVTSPPFWGLRDYSCEGQIGLEETPEAWCARLVAVMREARRVLRSDGVCWIEVGDTYATKPNNNAYHGIGPNTSGLTNPDYQFRSRNPGENGPPAGCKPKDLVGAPWLLAFALRADGWYLRSDTIWARPNPMPESVTDRPTKSHSYVFLLTKSAKYSYDADAIREEAQYGFSPTTKGDFAASVGGKHASHTVVRGNGEGGRNARSVWSIATEPTPFAHFATFPQALVERCIKAGTSEHGCCGECGAPWRRITEHIAGDAEAHARPKRTAGMDSKTSTLSLSGNGSAEWAKRGGKREALGWEPSCDHDAPIKPCVVLDCFMGSGTTALVARRLGRRAIGIELNAEYLGIAAKRLEQLSLFAQNI